MDRSNQRNPALRAWPIPILGVPFDNVTTQETIALLEEMVVSRRAHYVVTANVDFLVQALHDVELRRILLEAHLVLCDGTPLVWASRLLGNPLPERVAGSDLVPLLIKVAAQKGYRLFFLGGSAETTAQAIARLQTSHPNLIIAGHYSPPFQRLLDMDHAEMSRQILAAKPDLLFVSFGCPKQEKWIAMHYRTLGIPVSVGVGGTIDFLAGRLARAPRWMQRTGTEWIFRLAQEPRRLLRRYLKDCWYFGGRLLAQWWRLQFRARSPASAQVRAPILVEHKDWRQVNFPDWLDRDAVQRESITWDGALASNRHCLLDLSNVRFIDSTGVGLLIRLQKRAHLSGRQVILVSPSPAVRRSLDLMQLSSFFRAVPDMAAAQTLMQNFGAQQSAALAIEPSSTVARQSMIWQGEVTASNVDEVWSLTEGYISCYANRQPELSISLSSVVFIDSSGVGVMIRAKKLARQNGARLAFTGLQPDVRNVLRLAQLETYLLET
jgi:N-acetylglucosaminyldiphosphoundecaprenol N-acetyl-beta-D-mannosaminyltransferase